MGDRRAKSLPVETVATGMLIQLESEEPQRPLASLLGVGETLLSLASGTMNTTGLDEPWTVTSSSLRVEEDTSSSFHKSQSTSDIFDSSEGLGDAQRSISADSIPKLGDVSPVRRKQKSPGKMQHVVTIPLPPEASSNTIVVTESEWSSLHEEVFGGIVVLSCLKRN